MFDIGFSELLVVAIVALVVLGPERLPKAARFAGLWVRRARAQWHSVKDELERELASEELKRSLHDTQEALRETERRVREGAAATEREFEDLRASVRDREPPADDTPDRPLPSTQADAPADDSTPAPDSRPHEPRNG